MPRKRFGELSPEEVLMVGIDVEEANGIRLRAFADMFTGYAPEVSALFAEMADEEDDHRSQLEKLYEQRHGTLRRTLTQEDVLEVIEAHDLDDAEHLVFDSLTLRRALEVVLAAELQAQAFYGQALENTDEPELQALFRELSAFEADHVRGLEARIEALGDST